MPKKANAKKIAARAYGNEKALADAEDGKYLIARVIKALGNCGFSAEIDTGRGMRSVQVLVRGKFKCGTNGSTRVEPGVFVACDGVLEDVPSRQKNLEVVAVVNKQHALDRLRGSGRVSELAARGGEDGVDDLFDRSGEEEALDANPWAKRDEEREELAEEILARYKRRAAGVKGRVEEDLLRGKKEEVEERFGDDEPLEDEADLAAGGAPKKARAASVAPVAGALSRAERRALERAAAEAAAAASGDLAAADELAALYRQQEEEAALDRALAASFKARKPTKSWEEEADEIDIDAI